MNLKDMNTVRHAPFSGKAAIKKGADIRLIFIPAQIAADISPRTIVFAARISSIQSPPSLSIINAAAKNISGKHRANAEIILPTRKTAVDFPINLQLTSICVIADSSERFSTISRIRIAAAHHSGGMTIIRANPNNTAIIVCSIFPAVNNSAGFRLPKYSIIQYTAASPRRRKISAPNGTRHISSISPRRPAIFCREYLIS